MSSLITVRHINVWRAEIAAKARSRGFRCGTCGRVPAGLPTGWGFREPDEVFALCYIGKYLRTRINGDDR